MPNGSLCKVREEFFGLELIMKKKKQALTQNRALEHSEHNRRISHKVFRILGYKHPFLGVPLLNCNSVTVVERVESRERSPTGQHNTLAAVPSTAMVEQFYKTHMQWTGVFIDLMQCAGVLPGHM